MGPSLRWVLQDSGAFPDLPEVDQLTPEQVALGGGVDAATYLVRCPHRDVVVKLKGNGLEAEARALRAWGPYTTACTHTTGNAMAACGPAWRAWKRRPSTRVQWLLAVRANRRSTSPPNAGLMVDFPQPTLRICGQASL